MSRAFGLDELVPMQVNELTNDGLKRSYYIIVTAAHITAARDKRLSEIARSVTMPGFPPGKVPMSVVKHRYGSAVLGEVLEQSVTDTSRQVVSDRDLKPAMQPKIELTNFAEGADLEYRMDLEVLPDVPMLDFSKIELERLKAEPSEEAIAKALAIVAESNGEFADAEPRPATKGDILVCDIVGRHPENLLKNGPGFGARPGVPGDVPHEWSVHVSDGLACEVTAIGTEKALPHFDVAVKGTATKRGFMLVFPTRQKGVSAKAGEIMTFSIMARLAGGTLPVGALTRIGFNARSESDFIGGVRKPATLAGTDSVTLTMPDNRFVAFARPILDISVPAGVAVDFTLRIGPARVYSGAEDPEANIVPGGSATDVPIEVGGTGIIGDLPIEVGGAGFTEQLEGLAPGDSRDIEVVFPTDSGTARLAGAQVRFTITAKVLKARTPRIVDDELALAVGLKSLDALKRATRDTLQREYVALSRLKLKRALFKNLADGTCFQVPESMVAAEFNRIWQRVDAERMAGRLDEDDAGKDEETLKAEYLSTAERRVRLRLMLSEIGRAGNIEVNPEEVADAIRQVAMRYPGQERQVIEFFRKNPQAVEDLHMPLFEEKVVDFVLALTKVTERNVAPEELSAKAI